MSTAEKVLAFTATSLLLLIMPGVTYGQGHGANCNVSDPAIAKCDVSKYLVCSTEDNTCVCSGTGLLYYNETSLQCTAFAGAACITGSGFPKPCTPNSWCKPAGPGLEGVCECNFGFMKAPSGMCLLSHGSSGCRDERDCNQNAKLTCSYGTCLCELNNATYSNQFWDDNGDDSACLGLVGASCTRNPKCVEHAVCQNNRTCVCPTGFEENEDRFCKKGIGHDCTAHSECSSNNCKPNNATAGSEGKCSCREGEVDVAEKCYILPGQSCDGNRNCIANANCAVNENDRVCRCNEGFSLAGDKCLANYNNTCTVTTPPEEDICNGDSYLVCRNDTETTGRCVCAAGYEFNPSLGRCQGHFNATCTASRDSDCVFSTTCVNDQVTSTFKCQCESGLVHGDKETGCRAAYGQNCASYGCYVYDHHICSDTTATCTCKSDDLDPNPDGKCLGKIDTPCNTQDQNMPLFCVQFATCLPDATDTTQSTCKCPDAYHASDNKTMCLPGNGSGVLSISALAISAFFVFVRLL